MFINKNKAVHFDSFGIENIPQEVLSKIKYNFITHNIFGIQDDDSVMCEFYCIDFIEYMLSGKTLLDYTNLFFPNEKSFGFRLKKMNDETRNRLSK